MPLLEICTETVDGAVAAATAGAGRIELCTGLGEGGTTPSAGAILGVRRSVDVELCVLLRPRRGDFLYTSGELETLRADLNVARDLGADVVALGCLTPDGDVDRERTARLVEAARPLSVTFHRAFDLVRDQHAALETLVELGVDRVLTSGGAADVVAGAERLAELVDLAGDRLVVMAGGGVREDNVRRLVRDVGVREVHASASTWRSSAMRHRPTGVGLGGPNAPDEHQLRTVEEETVRRLWNAMR